MKLNSNDRAPLGLKGVYFTEEPQEVIAQHWAMRLKVPCVHRNNAHIPAQDWDLWLAIEKDKVQLAPVGIKPPGAIAFNFEENARMKRFQHAKHERNQPLAKAVGVSKGMRSIMDATAGWGIDTQMFLGWGFEVTALERNPVLAALWEHAIKNVRDAHLRGALERLDFKEASAIEFLRSSEDCWDVIYLDPMYPERKRGKLAVKKEMQIFRHLLGDDLDADALFELAKSKARHRVVVKRPKHAEHLLEQTPDLIVKGTVVRFDVYLSH